MPSLETPSTADVNQLIISQLETAFNQKIPLLPRAFNRVIAKILAAVYITLWKYCGFIFFQMFVKTAAFDYTEINGQQISPLRAWGDLKGVEPPGTGSNAELEIEIIVNSQTDSLYAGSQLVNNNTGVTYITLADVLLDAPTVFAEIRAVNDQAGNGGVGTIGNLEIGTEINFVNALPNINKTAVVTDQLITGADAEDKEVYRGRVLDAWQKVPQGGAYVDYEKWGEEAPGIINVYPYSGSCPGQVELYCEATPESSGNADGIPTQAQLNEVLDDYINKDVSGLASRRNANALPNTFGITRNGWKVNVIGILDVDSLSATYNDIQNGLIEYFTDKAPFIAGLTIPPRLDRINESAIAGVVEDIVSAHGGIFDSVEVFRQVESLTDSVFTNKEFDFSVELTNAIDSKFNDDGFKIFLLSATGVIYEYDLTTAFDPDTMSYSGNSFDVSTQVADPKAFAFSSSGSKLIVLGDSQLIQSYELSNGYDFSNPVIYTARSLDVSVQLGAALPYAVTFDTLGRNIFVGANDGNIYSYNTTSPFSIIGANYTGFSIDTGGQASSPRSLTFTDRGLKFTVLDSNGTAYEYKCGVPFDFGSVVVYTGNSFLATGQDNSPQSVIYNNDKSRLFVTGDQFNKVYEYETGSVDEQLTEVYTLGKGEKAKLVEVIYS
jgi:hypothetical protein